MTPRWLAEPELARFVADVRSAHRKHGGAGALYVYLRKSPALEFSTHSVMARLVRASN